MDMFRQMYRWITALGTAAAVFVVAPAAALASSPTTHSVGSGGAPPISGASPAGGLPFTGLDVVLLTVVATVLLLAGLALGRATSPEAA